MKKVVVTGATSMIGTALINRLIQSDKIEKIYTIVRPVNDNKSNSKLYRIPKDERISVIECDLNSYMGLKDDISDKCDVFYHLAWPRTATYFEGLADILLKCDALKGCVEAVRVAYDLGCTKFVGAGSLSEYGISESGKYSIDMECKPVRADGVLHLAANRLVHEVASDLGIVDIWMRIFSVYGVNDRTNSMISSTIEKLIKGEHCSFTKAEQIWDYINVGDVAEAFFIAGKKVKDSSVFNIATGNSRPLREYIEIIRDIVSPQAYLGFGEIEYPNKPILKMDVDISEIVRKTGWTPRISFEAGIKEIFENKMRGTY